MNMKASAIAPSNLALIKYMGRKDEVLRLPANGSISMNLSGCQTTTTIEFSDTFSEDSLSIDGQSEGAEGKRAFAHIDRIRSLAKTQARARIVSHNSFPRSTGLSSSSSGFAALTVAAVSALGLQLTEKELSILARQGSGSACRSIPDGFVEWKNGDTSETSFAETIFSPEHWDLCDVVAVITHEKKKVASSNTHVAVRESALFAPRIAMMPARIQLCKELLQKRDLQALGPLIEQESDDLHALYESVGIVQRTPLALELTQMVKSWRADLQAYYSLNTGQNVHVLCEAKDVKAVEQKLSEIAFVQSTIVNHPGKGVRVTDQHLF